MNRKAICTIASLNYFSQVKNLSRSIKKYHRDIDVFILIVDKVSENVMEKITLNNGLYKLVYLEELEIDNLYELAFKYDIMEFNTALKPVFIKYLFTKMNYQSVIYLDPDIQVFNKLDFLLDKIEHYSIILTPHILNDLDGGACELNEYLKHGIFNLGFIALKNDCNSQKLLDWWTSKLMDYCYYDMDNGMAWDQKWMDFIPVLCDSVYILKNPGYNVAFWNLHERAISKIDDEFYITPTCKLVFYHFSHYHINLPEYLVYFDDENKTTFENYSVVVREIYDKYLTNVMEMEYDFFSKIEYGFNYFSNGELILDNYRRQFATIKEKSNSANPFDITNILGIIGD